MGYHICGIYGERPEMCKRYPERDSYIPEECAYYFANGERKGECDPDCDATCCKLPRHNGEPNAPAMPDIAGGIPCKHLIYSETHPAIPGGGGDSKSGEDQAGGGEEPNPLELALSEIDRRRSGIAAVEGVGAAAREGSSGKKG